MKTNIIGRVSLAVFVALSAVATPATAEPARHVIIIGVDGLSTDGVRKAKMPVLRDMMAKGSTSLYARGVMPTSSSSNWASMINGAGPEQHGVTNNYWRVGKYKFPTAVTGSGNFFPSLFQIVTDQHPEWEVGAIYHWDGFGNLYDPRFVDYNVNPKTEDEAATLAADYIRQKKPNLLFVHLDHVDHAGHADGHGTPHYYEAVEKADRLIGQIRQATIEAGIDKNTTIIVTSDHGGVGKGHGGESLAELEIPWVAYGRAVRAGRDLDQPINTYDTPATAAKLLGVNIPYAWLGRPVAQALEGEPEPNLTYSTHRPAPAK
ncbi:MAG: alkaline phosphatase family protein [Asticcacaulis sp.]